MPEESLSASDVRLWGGPPYNAVYILYLTFPAWCVPIVGRMLGRLQIKATAVSPLATMCKSARETSYYIPWYTDSVERVRHIIGRVTLYTYKCIVYNNLRVYNIYAVLFGNIFSFVTFWRTRNDLKMYETSARLIERRLLTCSWTSNMYINHCVMQLLL